MLTAFQEEVARLLSALPEASGFALAGGAALILRGDVDRATEDLDFFAPPPHRSRPSYRRCVIPFPALSPWNRYKWATASPD